MLHLSKLRNDKCINTANFYVLTGTWHQFDGVVCPQRGKFDFVWKYIPGVKNIGREDAFRVFFPRWNGFHMSKIDSSVTVVQALAQLSNLVETLSRPWIMREYGGVCQERIPVDRLNLPQVSAIALIIGYN